MEFAILWRRGLRLVCLVSRLHALVKVTFFQGTALRPLPPGASKHKDVRYLDIYEDGFDEAQLANWVRQAAELPGFLGP